LTIPHYLCDEFLKNQIKMKRVALLLVFLLAIGLGTSRIVGGMNTVCQDQEEALIPSEDSVSIDDMDPIFYEAEEDEQMGEGDSAGSAKMIVGIVVLVILLGLGFLFINRSRTQKKE
jgi:hypothetical protein